MSKRESSSEKDKERDSSQRKRDYEFQERAREMLGDPLHGVHLGMKRGQSGKSDK